MPYIFLGSLAFLFFVAYDINSVTINNRLLQGGFFIGCILLIGATGGIISATIKEAIWYSIRTPIFLTAAIVFLVFLVYTLFFAIPFETTYLKTDQPPKTCTTGLYALSRHPGVLWFAGFYFSLWLALSGSLLLAAGILFTILNFLYVVLQDRWIFMIIFPDYGQYKKTTPFDPESSKLYPLYKYLLPDFRKEGAMVRFEDKLKNLPSADIWQEYCGFLDLDIDGYMRIQNRLMLEQISLWSKSGLGRHLLNGKKPKTINEFRRQVPLTSYGDYADILLQKQEDMLPDKPIIWIQTTWEGGKNPIKVAPYTRGMLDTYKNNILACLILCSSTEKGKFNVKPTDNFLYGLAPLPYATGLFPLALNEEIRIGFLPPVKEAVKMSFGERNKKGFRMGLSKGIEFFFGLGSVAYFVSLSLSSPGGGSKTRGNSGDTKQFKHSLPVLYRMLRAKYRCKKEKRELKPKDLFKLKGLVVAGTDNNCYKDDLEDLWGVRPIELFAGTEPSCIGTESWTKDGLYFFPDACFYEFIPEDEMYKSLDRPDYHPKTYLMNEVMPDKLYELVISVLKGGAFVRYRVGDVYRCVGIESSADKTRIPRFRYVDRTPNIIDIAGFTRISENSIRDVVNLSGLNILDWFAVKEYNKQNRPLLHMYVEMKREALSNSAVTKEILREHLSVYFKYVDNDYKDLKQILGMDPLEITILKCGTFEEYRRKKGASIRTINPSPYEVMDLLELQKEDYERNRGWHFLIGNFVVVPVAALFCYLFLLLAFMAAKKNALINSFLIVLSALILWTGGSLCMRMLLWPSIKFWYDISILGLLLFPFAMYNFIEAFVGSKDSFLKKVWLVLVAVEYVVNVSTGALLAHPVLMHTAGGGIRFVYHPTWTVSTLFAVNAAIIAHMIYILVVSSKKNEMLRKQFTPIILGILSMFAGHMIIMLPALKGFPADILSGVINAFFMFYALYRRRLFKLTLLVSRGICYFITLGLAILIFSNVIPLMERVIQAYFNEIAQYDVLTIAVLFTLAILLLYYGIKKFIDNVFIREEIVRAENLKKFSYSVSKSLHIEEILEELVAVIQNTIGIKKVYVCVSDSRTGEFTIAHSTSPLDCLTFSIQKDNPLVIWLSENGECLLMKDFKRTMAYKSMWETEKKQLADLDIECLAPLKDEEQLIGIVLLSGKERGGNFAFDDVSFLASVDSIGSIAVKNSKLYEKVYHEARTDELTGLLNRKYFYETIQEVYNSKKDHALALIILNIDDFKLYNQLYGNKEGDIVLQRVAQIIRATVGNNGYVARYGGKEFAIILPMYDILAAKTLAENIRKQILNMNKRAKDYTLKVLTVSGGICAIPHSASTVTQLIDNADMAVYHAKRKGKNLILAYSVEKKELSNAESVEEDRKADIYAEYAPTIYALTAAIDAKDHYTFNHSKRVAYYATKLAYAYGMDDDYVRIIKEAALLHDIGKIGIPEQILNKAGRLSDDEYEEMKSHVENSIGIIKHLPSLDYVIPAVIGHHERYDGKGYPRRIAREDIPISARMLCIADAFDAMTSQRSYKQPVPMEEAIQILENGAGRQFDPVLIPIFVHLVRNGLVNVKEEMDKFYEEEATESC